MYKVIIDKKVFKSLDKIPVVYLPNIKEAVNNLANNPRPFGYIKFPALKTCIVSAQVFTGLSIQSKMIHLRSK
jgi:hypothetical protein